jgi:hypothetical protein
MGLSLSPDRVRVVTVIENEYLRYAMFPYRKLKLLQNVVCHSGVCLTLSLRPPKSVDRISPRKPCCPLFPESDSGSANIALEAAGENLIETIAQLVQFRARP